ncbi:MAG: NACHT domain-containing protein, partial [Cyanobacteria bacterium J06642_11]
MATEQQAGRPCFGSDLYSLGMVMLQGLTGRHPMSFDIPVRCSDVGLTLPPSLAQFLDRLVHLDHRQRYHTAGEALKAWRTLNNDDNSKTAGAKAQTDSSTTHVPKTALNTTLLPTTESTEATALLSETRLLPDIPTHKQPPATAAPEQTAPTGSTRYSHQDYRNRQALLNKVRRFWIEGVLERSLHGQVLLTLGLEERPDAIAPPWQVTYASPGQAPQPLPPGTQASHVFDAIGEGRTLVILGEPGAGKTTTLLNLARTLLQRVEQHRRLPVIFNLSSWLNQPIEQWLVQELNSKYQVPKAIGQRWVTEQQLLLLLDGLDEVALERRAACVTALNQFHQDYGPEMVVCSRIHDYEALPEKLSFQAALFLRPLTDAQILAYLNRPDHGLTGLKSLLEKDAAIEDSQGSLFELARSPLIL